MRLGGLPVFSKLILPDAFRYSWGRKLMQGVYKSFIFRNDFVPQVLQ